MTIDHPFPEDVRRLAKDWFDHPVASGRDAFKDLRWSPSPYLAGLEGPPHALSLLWEIARAISDRSPERQRVANDLYPSIRTPKNPIPDNMTDWLDHRWMSDAGDNFAYVKEQDPIAEKISADLAFVLDLPVAPVRLWEVPVAQTDSAKASRYFSAALLVFPDVKQPKIGTWFDDPFWQAMHVFDWWVDNRDKREMCAPKNPETSRQKSLIYYDWGLSFGQITYRDLLREREPGSIKQRDSYGGRGPSDMSETQRFNHKLIIERIADFSDATLRDIISHVPDALYEQELRQYSAPAKDYDYKQKIMEHLTQGRDVLRETRKRIYGNVAVSTAG